MTTRFKDIYLPARIPGYPATVAPRYRTEIAQSDSGAEQANQRWAEPLRSVTLPTGVRSAEDVQALIAHWHILAGPAHSFAFRDPFDFASATLTKPNVVPVLTRTDQVIGTGDGVTTEFQLTKTYSSGAETRSRSIILPVTSTVLVGIDGNDPSSFSPAITWTVTRPGGVIAFNSAPDPGAVITAGFLFDIEVRFDSDDALQNVLRTYGAAGFSALSFTEVRYCP